MKLRRSLWLLMGFLLSAVLLSLTTAQAGDRPSAAGASAGIQQQDGAGKAAHGEKVNINTADLERLTTLPGVGPKTAERIQQYRQENGAFRRLDDLKKVRGIGEKNFEKIKPFITI